MIFKGYGKLLHGDCLEVMKTIPDNSIDMVFADLPYGVTACKWDSLIPLEPLWEQYTRVVKKGRALVFTATQPFTSMLVMSKPKWFKHEWVWDKVIVSGVLNSNKQPMGRHETVLVFGCGAILYNPQKEKRRTILRMGSRGSTNNTYGKAKDQPVKTYSDRHPTSILALKKQGRHENRIHPTQKPTALIEYLIKTYSNQGDTILDNVIGSGSTAIAAINTGRKFVGIEKDPAFYEVARKRIEQHIRKMKRSFGILNT